MEKRSIRSLKTGRCAGGFTLFELLIVMLVLGILMGIGAAYLIGFSRGFQLESEASRVATFLTVTRDTAVDTGSPAFLMFVKRGPDTVMIYTGREVRDSYMMEDTSGAFGRTFTLSGGEFKPGLAGNCLYLGDGEYADLGNNPGWRFEQGFHVEMFVRISQLDAETELLAKEDLFTLSLVPSGPALVSLKGTVMLESGGEQTCSNSSITFDMDRWVRIGFSSTGTILSLYLDGSPIAEAGMPGDPAHDTGGNMFLLKGSSGCEAYIDEMVVSRYGIIGERSLGSRVSIKELDGHTFLHVEFSPDGMTADGNSRLLRVYFGGKPDRTVSVHISRTGSIYKGQL